jgi:hypothetical protein
MRKGATWSNVLHKYNSMKRWMLALVIVAAFISYPLLLLAALLWGMLKVLAIV